MAGPTRQDFERDIEGVRSMQADLARGAGGTPGGTWLFFWGLALAAAGLWAFLGSVQVVTSPCGMVSGVLSHGMFGGGGASLSTGMVFAPIFIGLVLLFYDARWKAGWALFYVGLALIVIEVMSRIQFLMNVRSSHLLLMLGMVAAGIGMMLRSFRDAGPTGESTAGGGDAGVPRGPDSPSRS